VEDAHGLQHVSVALVHAQYAARQQELAEALSSPQAMLKYRDDRRARYRAIMGQRVVDILSVVDFISADPKMKDPAIRLMANGAYGHAAIRAAYLDPRIKQTELSRSMRSFTEPLENPIQKEEYSNVLYGVLQYYDLPDLMDKIGRDKTKFAD
jgi:hypothetical protein